MPLIEALSEIQIMPMRTAVLLVCALALALGAGKTYAYIDPDTGSAVLQAIVAAGLAGGLALKLSWRRIRACLANLFSRRDKTDEP